MGSPTRQPAGARPLFAARAGFDKPTWLIYEDVAAERSRTARQMITAPAAGCLGPILVANDSRRRWSNDATPIRSWLRCGSPRAHDETP